MMKVLIKTTATTELVCCKKDLVVFATHQTEVEIYRYKLWLDQWEVLAFCAATSRDDMTRC